MHGFLTYCKTKQEQSPMPLVRISETCGDGIDTIEFQPTCFCQNVYSVAKTYTMTAIGLLYDKGLLRLDEPVCEILKEELPETGMDERWHLTTVETALTHKIGLPGGFLDIDVNKSKTFTDDFLTYMLTYPLIYTPGTDSMYTDGAYYLLARIAEKKTGMGLDNFLWRELFSGMDYQEMAWSHCPMGHCMGATGLYVHTSDMVKLGLLYLDGGRYEGRQYLSAEWTEIAREKNFALDWLDKEHTMFAKGGMYGQTLCMDRTGHRVVAVQSFGGDMGKVFEWMREYREQDLT